MKHGKNPTARQKRLMAEMGLIYENWLVERETNLELVVVHRHTEAKRTIPKLRCK